MWKNSNAKKSVIALILGIFFVVVVSEIFLQIIDFPARPISGWLNCKEKHPEQCNSMGFRGQEIAYSNEDFVIILLGDSEAYAALFPFEQIPEQQLEHFLQKFKKGVKVFTLADMGYGQDQQYLALKKYFVKYRADLVLLMFTARNDIYNNIFPTAGGNNTIKPTFWLEYNELHGPTEGWLEPVGSRIKLVLLWEIYSGQYDGKSRNKMWEEKILPTNLQSPGKYQEEMNHFWHQGRDSDIQKADSRILTHNSERAEYGMNLTKKLFLKIKELADANNSHFIIFEEERPLELQDLGKYDKELIKQNQYKHQNLFRDFESYTISLNMENYTISQDNTHLNEQAVKKLMKELSFIISQKDYFR